ncbi:MAG: tRNA isopentenyl-2-thiomethyl-A-37 hydroxylase MiaE [Myxococcota bacterium]|jgi:tRNA-(ms[2]io[6]A)-hydroxylase|nr:tRNA isopentenyl-2-thiomethyl-A-37 hydroxylase MiaE [Myxococcota bacterium]MDP7074156.1 tRNA isopentenyl-2-thiomethyl-A-37 hydroxylase MiaE [Myxococcota bacterium]MDP7299837.1 tRNA isopentenyl-2-thiomethyl-A-37 hydroxylase MiaE [Myxococcota bacterium]MDP7432336.1 tRNA isopentenyl-2-thiomethyl-A-37 hydroxylase MiaE [Myxococcota bacterium]HJO22441.1 tRNA isopentenyl-2-thiomethyl-A-37 hydroxylase MiaE [Myxococcota bacterium]
MFNLAAPTQTDWLERALGDLDAVLLDHAHCERKAAGMAVRLLFRYPEHGFLQVPLSRLARDELEHFEQVLAALDCRGVAFDRQKPSPYAGRLRERVRSREPGRLVDTLLCSALIEARSCERFALLAKAVPDSDIAALYSGLLPDEVRHHRVYLELAEEIVAAAAARERFRELAEWEVRVLNESPALPRMHT